MSLVEVKQDILSICESNAHSFLKQCLSSLSKGSYFAHALGASCKPELFNVDTVRLPTILAM